jgi:hypothetical protein
MMSDARAELAQLEEQMESLRQSAAVAADPGFEPGQYEAGPVVAEFSPDGTFTLAQREGDRAVAGRYSLENGVLVLSDVSGDTGRADFPMRCSVEPAEGGFRLEATDGSCRELAGMQFQR